MPPQIVRLIVLTIVIVTSYLMARSVLTPSSFGQYGFYRGDALGEVAGRDPVFAGSKVCIEVCHDDIQQVLAKGDHKTLACESCHGAGQAHADKPDVNRLVKLSHSTCVRCHEADPSRPKWLKQVVSKTHYGQTCTECHVPHQPKEMP